ncbi:MAG: outer membrane beta-barrel protein [Armatimonadota bacterium]
MRTWSTFAAAAALVAGLATASQAQTPVNPLLPTTGTREIAFDGNIQFDPATNVNINGSYGPFLNPNLQVGGNFGYSKLEGSDSFYSIGGFANYHFPGTSAALPFVGVFLGVADGGGSDSSFTYGVQGGVKYFLNPNVAATAALRFQDYSDDGADSSLGLNFGLAVYLR